MVPAKAKRIRAFAAHPMARRRGLLPVSLYFYGPVPLVRRATITGTCARPVAGSTRGLLVSAGPRPGGKKGGLACDTRQTPNRLRGSQIPKMRGGSMGHRSQNVLAWVTDPKVPRTLQPPPRDRATPRRTPRRPCRRHGRRRRRAAAPPPLTNRRAGAAARARGGRQRRRSRTSRPGPPSTPRGEWGRAPRAT